jgi:hypothetical protein
VAVAFAHRTEHTVLLPDTYPVWRVGDQECWLGTTESRLESPGIGRVPAHHPVLTEPPYVPLARDGGIRDRRNIVGIGLSRGLGPVDEPFDVIGSIGRGHEQFGYIHHVGEHLGQVVVIVGPEIARPVVRQEPRPRGRLIVIHRDGRDLAPSKLLGRLPGVIPYHDPVFPVHHDRPVLT